MAIIEVPLPYRILKESESDNSDPIDAVIFVGISLVLGITCRHLLRGTRVPYTVALLLLGIGLGTLEYGTKHKLGRIGDGIRLWSHIDPDLLLAVFLPALLFESSFAMEVHQIKRCMVQMFLLAGPGVLISTFFLGSALKLIFPYGWSWKTSLLLGGLLSATDPVAVVALLKELGASKKLSTIIEGESLMNDGTAIVVYQLFYRMVLGWTFDWGGIIKFLAQVSLGALGIGLAFGITSVLWLGFIFNDTVIEITLTLAVSYIAYFTAQVGADISGVLTVMTLGMFYSAFARTAFKGESQESLHNFWEMVAYIANTLIFILSGVVIAEGVFVNDSILKTHENSWGYLFLLYVFVQISRVVVVGVLFPFLRYFGYGLDWKEAIILIWSGLRGAVALSLSLSVKRSSDNSKFISPDTGTLFVFLTGGIVFLTLIVNGSSTQFVLRMLNMDKLSAAKWRILKYTKFEMLNKALEAFGDLGEDEELGPADWPAVKKYISSLDDVDGERIHPHNSSEGGDNLDNMNLTDIRVRFLNGVQAAYWEMLDEGRINRTTANLMMQSVDEALDMISHEALCDWKGLSSNVNIPNYYKFLQTSIVPRKFVTHFIVERLESACYICAAFLRAHRIARIQLHDFIGNSEIASLVIKESEDEEQEPKRFLEEVRVSFPEVLRVVKTRQVTYSVLSHLSDYVQKLEKIGLLEEKEMVHLHDAVQTDMKKLLRNPPLVKVPTLRDLIQDNPLLGALPSDIREKLLGSTKETIKLRNAIVYKEGSKPNAIWLISNGVVKWSSKGSRNNPVLHPTFTHRSTLGLYEVLAGKPYICDVVTDTVVLCVSIEAEKIHTALKSNPTVEDFFWRESTITLSKVLLPHVFEKLSMHELRTIIAERSSIYIRGETFEIPHNFVAFLLEGFVKSQGFQEELITSPAALGPSHGGQSYRRSETSGAGASTSSHHVSWYKAETRTRIILCDIAEVETRTLPRKPSLPKPHPIDYPSGSLASVHSGLMSWPEQYFDLRQRKKNDIEKADEPKNNLSARAMQLNIYGSMVENARWHTKGLLRSTKSQPPHSHSYLSVPLNRTRPLVAAKSEGTIVKKVEATEGKYQTQNPGLVDSQAGNDPSDDSGPEEEHLNLIRIDSPSGLSFRNEL